MKRKVNPEDVRRLIRHEIAYRCFWHFCLHYDNEFFSKRLFLKEIADALQEIEEDKIDSLSVSMPPRAGKSYVTSLFCAWTIGRNPVKSVMRNTCTATLYLKFSYDVRTIVKSEKFRQIFEVTLSKDKSNLQGWNTGITKMVSYFGAGVGGTIIGFGASNVGITDDLYRGLEDALSDTVNDRIIQWKEATHDSRFESGCKRIDIGTRWSINDVIGRNMENDVYDKSIIVRALDDNDKSFCEDVLTSEEYIDKRKKTPPEIWAAEYQQNPVDLKGRLFSDLLEIRPEQFEELLPKMEGFIAYCDVSDQGNDYTSLAIAGMLGNKVYIVDYLFSRSNTDVTIPMVAEKLNKWNVNYCRIESNSMGAMFSRSVQKLTKTKILQVHNSTNKITRIIMQSAFVLNTMVFVRYENPDCTLFIENVLSFSKEGKNKNDDAPDTLAGLSMFIRSMFKKLF